MVWGARAVLDSRCLYHDLDTLEESAAWKLAPFQVQSPTLAVPSRHDGFCSQFHFGMVYSRPYQQQQHQRRTGPAYL